MILGYMVTKILNDNVYKNILNKHVLYLTWEEALHQVNQYSDEIHNFFTGYDIEGESFINKISNELCILYNGINAYKFKIYEGEIINTINIYIIPVFKS